MLGVAIVSFDRPQYLRRLLGSLERCAGVDGCEVHLWQDGAVNRFSGVARGDEERIRECVRAFQAARLPARWAHTQRRNVGIGINEFEAIEWMTERYERVLLLEDDVVLSPWWVRLCGVLCGQLDEGPHPPAQAPTPDPSPVQGDGRGESPGWGEVFGFSLGFRRECRIGEVWERLDRVGFGVEQHWWGECFRAESWRRIRPHYLRYYELIRERDYWEVPHQQVLELFAGMGYAGRGTSQDAGRDMAVWAAGLRRAVTTVNRGMGIGKEGMHFTPERFKVGGFEGQWPYVFAEDEHLERFVWEKDDVGY